MLSFHLWPLHTFLVLALGIVVVVALVHATLVSGDQIESEGGWGDYLYSRISLGSSQHTASTVLPLWSRLSTGSLSSLSSEQSYHSPELNFVGKYAKLRAALDYTYHSHYSPSRQLFQDSIIDAILNETTIVDEDGNMCAKPAEPWIIYTAGAMGAGKSYTIRQLATKRRFPLHSFVRIDYDAVRKHLPEFQLYIQQHPERAGEWTRKETGYIAELATQAALQRSHNVLVDGSLRDADWYRNYFRTLRRHHPRLRIGILHVTAPREAVFQRAEVCVGRT